jgi:hypothetical protein
MVQVYEMPEQRPSPNYSTVVLHRPDQNVIALVAFDEQQQVCDCTAITCVLAGNGAKFQPWFENAVEQKFKAPPEILYDGGILFKNDRGVLAYMLAIRDLYGIAESGGYYPL